MSTVQIRKAVLGDAENIITLLDQFYPGVPHHWRKLFAPRHFKLEEDFPGLVIVDAERIVGFLGTIFYDHETTTGKMTLCNLTTWYVEPAYRQHSMAMFLKVMKLPNVTAWTNLTAAPHTYEWFNRSGFQSFVDVQTVIFPLPSLFSRHKEVRLTIDITENDLPPAQQAVYRMHQQPHCRHILIKKGKEQCYCIVILTRYKKVPLANLYYISDQALLGEVIAEIRMKLCWKLRAAYLVMDGEFKKNRLGLRKRKLFPPRMFKSTRLSSKEMVLLGSELFVLGI